MPNSCFIIGNGVVALKCLQILIKTQFNIIGVYSSDRSLQSWADDHNIVYASTRSEFYHLLLSAKYDYLFSINNSWILPPEIIAQAQISTINYHNSPLPKYAGLYATSWALIHNETQHAISWHEVIPAIDAGRILKQVMIPIAEDDTALSLNTRCFEVAVAAFEELVKELAENQVVYHEQDLSHRSYFGQGDRPSAACLLNFEQSTQTLSNLVRALDFGPSYNALGLPKLWLPKGIVVVGAARLLEHLPLPNPGQVLVLDESGLGVATADGAILLSHIRTQAGIPVGQDELREYYGVQIGTVLPMINAQMRDTISQHNATICRHESQWVKHLSDLQPLIHPNFQTGAIANSKTVQRYPIALPCPLKGRSLLSLFAAYCARLANEPFDLALQTDAQRSFAPEIFAQWVPIRIQADSSESCNYFQEQFEAMLAQTCRLGNYTLDILARYPELRQSELSTVLFIGIVHALNPSCLEIDSLSPPVVFAAYEDGSSPELLHKGTLDQVQSQAIAQQLQIFIAACVHNPQQSLCSLPLMSAEERQQILVEWNQTAAPYPRDRCIHELISAQAARTPNAVAVRFNNQQLSYQELEQRSHQLACWLRLHGVKPDRLVALCVPRSLELIIGLLGILKAGGAYVPIDPTYPVDHIAYLLENSCCQAVVTIATLRDTLFPQAAHVICLDQQVPLLAELDTVPFESGVTPENLAYVIYTSGSTGMPKGVEICHRALVNHSWAIANIYSLTSSDRLLQSASISFDIAGEQIYPALFQGAEIIIRPDDLMESFDRFSKFVNAQVITVLILPTAFWHEWVIDLIDSGQEVPCSVRLLGVGTEKVLSNCLEQWQDVSKGEVAFFQGYGPTETTVTCTLYQHHGRNSEIIPIGRPLPNTEVYILDRHYQPVPIGMVGEIYIGGDGLARGYHQRPDLTAKSFIDHPFRRWGDTRLYKTGDLGRFEPDGQLIYCGRSDYQIKLHGYRIELGAIETMLNQHPEVKQAVVQTYEVKNGDRALVAYVVLKTQLVTAQQLQQFLGQKLPSYMQPGAIVFIDALPLTATGKVNRRALPEPQQSQRLLETSYSAPRDALERQLVKIWETVLEIQPISIQDNFFALGGSSLSAVRLADKIQAVFKSNLPLAVIFQASTLAQLTDILRLGEKPLTSTLVPIQPQGTKPPLFLFQGVGLYYPLASCLAPDQPIYGLSLEMIEEQEISGLSIAQLVDRYLQDLQSVYPQGPYLLGGVSFGGLVAFEAAQKLRAQGHEVALLALFDTPAPGASTFKPALKRFQGHLCNLCELGPTYLQYKVTNKLLQVNYLLSQFTRRKSHTNNYKVVRQMYQQIAKTQSLKPYPGRITLFLATDRSAASDSVFDPRLVDIDPKFGWGSLAEGGLDIYEIPGDHLSILKKPQVEILAENLKICLEEVVASHPFEERHC